jgi:GNAT superfamily N-acetyltransferase
MSQSVEISIAKEEDIPALCTLLELLFSQEHEFSPNIEAQRQGLHSIIHNPHVGFILVGKVNGRAAGMVNILFTISTALGERVAILEDMVVSVSCRSSGIGTALIEQAIAEARNRGCKRITLLADASNDAAHRFYQRHGFVKSTMIPLRLNLMSE